MTDLTSKKCVPCNGGIPPLSSERENFYLKQVKEWNLIIKGIHRIEKKYNFKNFKESMEFVNKVAELAEVEGHHPDIHIYYNTVELELHTHAIKGMHENDFILAAKIDQI